MTFVFTRRDVVIVPWRSEGAGSENLAQMAFELYGCAEICGICIRFWQRVSK